MTIGHLYDLGYHLVAKMICRIPKGRIPPNTVKVIRYRDRRSPRFVRYPYDPDGALKPEYWSIWRAEDLDRMTPGEFPGRLVNGGGLD